MALSLQTVMNAAVAKTGYTVTPSWKSLSTIRTLLNDMSTVRSTSPNVCTGHSGFINSGKASLGDFTDLINTIKGCTCNSQTQAGCGSQMACPCNTKACNCQNNYKCDCNADNCSCNQHDDCSCNTDMPNCSCDGDYCGCNSDDCSCDSESNCTCVSDSCTCQNQSCTCNTNNVTTCPCNAFYS